MSVEQELQVLQDLQNTLLEESSRLRLGDVELKKTIVAHFAEFNECLAQLSLIFQYTFKSLKVSKNNKTGVYVVSGDCDVAGIDEFLRFNEFSINFRRNFLQLQLKLAEGIPHEPVKVLPIKEETAEDKLLATNRKITAKLLTSNQILQSSVLQSELNLDELATQSQNLSTLNEKFSAMDLLLNSSNKLVKHIEKAETQEARQIYFALGFLCVCFGWVLWRRIIRYPVKLVFWLWFQFMKSILFGMGLVKKVGGEKSASVVSDVISATAVASTVESGNAIEFTSAVEDAENVLSSIISAVASIDESYVESFSQTVSAVHQITSVVDQVTQTAIAVVQSVTEQLLDVAGAEQQLTDVLNRIADEL